MTRRLPILLAVCMVLLAGGFGAPGRHARSPAESTGASSPCSRTAASCSGASSNAATRTHLLKDLQGKEQFKIALLRFTLDGRLDTAFNGGGSVTTTVGEVSDVLNGVAVQSDEMLLEHF
jgi:hypothetical protein